ncbi:MAG: carboxypeptidase regulatory-like domain-containing protein [Silvibacterium sp.]
MKTRLIFALCLFLAALPEALCSVRVEPIPEAMQRPRITVLLNGTPVAGAKIEIYRSSNYPKHAKKLRFRLVTDAKGQMLLPELPLGVYGIVAHSEPNLTANLTLRFSPGSAGKEGLFSMELQSLPTREQILAADEKLPIRKIAAFHGVVQDETGAPIPKASIEVTDMGIQGMQNTTHLHSNAKGKFSVKLPNGDYIATFYSSGFKQRVLHLVIVKAENANDLSVELQIGDATQ